MKTKGSTTKLETDFTREILSTLITLAEPMLSNELACFYSADLVSLSASQIRPTRLCCGTNSFSAVVTCGSSLHHETASTICLEKRVIPIFTNVYTHL